jgi:NADPH:quinone reductase-like Zn-dependent oxidoreductase
MRAFVCRVSAEAIGPPTLEQRPPPGPLGSGQVRVGMRAASLNYRDLIVLAGGSACHPTSSFPAQMAPAKL